MRKKLSFACFRDSVKWSCYSCSIATHVDGTQVGVMHGPRKHTKGGWASRQRHTCPSLHGCEHGWPMPSSGLHCASHIALTVNTFKNTELLEVDQKYIRGVSGK
jgi:hypothetical protein